jgi:hypothetical protein
MDLQHSAKRTGGDTASTRRHHMWLRRAYAVLLTAVLGLPIPGHAHQATPTSSGAGSAMHKASPYRPEQTTRASEYYQSLWGIDNLLVRRTASGSLIRFSFRVVDPRRAGVLTDDRDTPHLIDPKRNVALQVPKMEQVGELRQRGEPVANVEYWMVFSNKGDPVKVGDRVNVIIGSFHGDGLLVE